MKEKILSRFGFGLEVLSSIAMVLHFFYTQDTNALIYAGVGVLYGNSLNKYYGGRN